VSLLAWLSVFVPFLGRALIQQHPSVPSGRIASFFLLAASIALGLRSGASFRSQLSVKALAAIVWVVAASCRFVFDSEGGSFGPVGTQVILFAIQGAICSWWLLSLGSHSFAALGGSLTICSIVAWTTLIRNQAIYLGTEWSDAATYRDVQIATPINLALLLGMCSAWWLTLLPKRAVPVALVLFLSAYGSAVCLQRWIVFAGPILILLCARKQPRTLLGASVLIAGVIGAFVVFAETLRLQNFFEYLDDFREERSFMYQRIDLLRASITEYLAMPVFGLGLDRWEEGYYPHNFVVQSLTDLGLLAGMSALVMFFGCFFALWSGASRGPHRKPIAAVAFMAWLHCMKAGDLTLVSLLLPLTLMSDATTRCADGVVSAAKTRSLLRVKDDKTLPTA
jgi:hypothetical protein